MEEKKEAKIDKVEKEKDGGEFNGCVKWCLFIFIGVVVIAIISAISSSGTPKRTYTLPTTTNTTSSSSWNATTTERKAPIEHENALSKAESYLRS